MKTAKFLLVLFATAILTACDSGDDGSGKKPGDFGTIQVPDMSQLTQTTYADQTQPAKGVSFSTTGAWTSGITDVTRAEAPDWLSISPDHGTAAGSYTLQITLTPNNTGAERTAKIVITCGTSKIEITVTQRTSDSPDEPGPAAKNRIDYIDEFYQSEKAPEEGRRWVGRTYLEYDDKGRPITYKYDDTPENSSDKIDAITKFTYPSATSIRIEAIFDTSDPELKINSAGMFSQADRSGRSSETVIFLVTLDASGRAIELLREGVSDRLTFSYDAEGRCNECRPYDISTSGSDSYSKVSYGWTSGNLSSIDTYDKNGEKVPYLATSFDYNTQDNSTTEMNIDLNAYLFGACPELTFESPADILSVLAAFDRLGKRSAKLTMTNYDEYASSESTDGEYRWYTDVSSDIKWSDNPVTLVNEVVNIRSIKENIKTGEKEVLDTNNKIYSYEIHYTK